MTTVTKTVGTTGRDYSTITLWEADLDNAAVYSAADDAVGECYDDSAFNESFTINGGGTIGLTSIKLSVAAGERHDGTAGIGSRIVRTSDTVSIATVAVGVSTTIEWLEIDVSSASNYSLQGISLTGIIGTETHQAFRNIIHGIHTTSGTNAGEGIRAVSNIIRNLCNNIIYDVTYNGSSDSSILGALNIGASNKTCNTFNNTIHNIDNKRATSTAAVYGLDFHDGTQQKIQNNISTSVITAGSGTPACYNPSSPASATCDHNLSSDSTASGTASGRVRLTSARC